METINYKGFDILINQDEMAENPRTTWDNFGKMVCFPPEYNLGDAHKIKDIHHLIAMLTENKDKYIFFPLRLYDHSGITISVNNNYPYTDKWDSTFVGFIYVELDNTEISNWSKEWIEKYHKNKTKQEIISDILKSEVEIYDKYLTGDVYYYDIEGIDYCGGFFGTDFEKNGLLDYAKNAIDCHISDINKIEKEQRTINAKIIVQNKSFNKRKLAKRII